MGSLPYEMHVSGTMKSIKDIKHLPNDFVSIKSEYFERIDTFVTDHNTLDYLIIK